MSATTLFLVRHAAHDAVDRVLVGRTPGVRLSAAGRAQAARLGGRLARERPAAVFTSPQPRAAETAAAIAARCGGLPVREEAALDEIAFGGWAGRGFAALADDPAWRRWNEARATARPPGDGAEGVAEVQARVLGWAGALPARYPDAAVVAVSHGDVVKAALFGLLGLSLDAHWRLEVSPAGVSAVQLWGNGGGRVLFVNEGTAAAAPGPTGEDAAG